MADPRSSVDQPLLTNEGPSFTPPIRHSSTAAKYGTRSRFRKWLKPLVILSLPPLLIMIYSLVHQRLDLPALPKVRIENGNTPEILPAQIEQDYEDKMRPAAVIPSCACGATARGKQLCETYHESSLQNSVLYRGSGARMRHLLWRAREGQPIKIGILGGSGESLIKPRWLTTSVSACRGVHPSPEFPEGKPSGPGCYTTLLKQWFETTFPKSSVGFTNGAIGGMDSSYYAFCGVSLEHRRTSNPRRITSPQTWTSSSSNSTSTTSQIQSTRHFLTSSSVSCSSSRHSQQY